MNSLSFVTARSRARIAVAALCAFGIGLTLILAAAAEPADAAKPKVSLVKARAVTVIPIEINRFAYTDRVYLNCRGNSTPLMVGWSSPSGTVGAVSPYTYGAKSSLQVMMVAPAHKGKFKASVACLNRNLYTKTKKGSTSPGEVSRVSCSKRQVAIGMPVNNAPYYTENVFSRPVGSRGWEANDGYYSSASVFCVAKKSMRAIKTVKSSVPFKAGTATTKVSARCKGGRVPISWGFESDHMPKNEQLGASLMVSAPLISQSKRQGRTGWSLTFFTPDGKPAVEQGRVAIHLTCAKPR